MANPGYGLAMRSLAEALRPIERSDNKTDQAIVHVIFALEQLISAVEHDFETLRSLAVRSPEAVQAVVLAKRTVKPHSVTHLMEALYQKLSESNGTSNSLRKTEFGLPATSRHHGKGDDEVNGPGEKKLPPKGKPARNARLVLG